MDEIICKDCGHGVEKHHGYGCGHAEAGTFQYCQCSEADTDLLSTEISRLRQQVTDREKGIDAEISKRRKLEGILSSITDIVDSFYRCPFCEMVEGHENDCVQLEAKKVL